MSLKYFALLLIMLCVTVIARAQQKDLIFATYQYAENDRVKNIEPFARHFSSIAGTPCRVVSYPSVHELIAALAKGEADIAFINSFGYLLLQQSSSDYAIAAALHVPEEAASTYQTAFVANKGTGIERLTDLKARAGALSLLLVNPGSTSGNLVPRLKLAEVGISNADSAFSTLAYSKNHALTLRQVIEGKADVGAFGSEEYHKLLKTDPSITKKINLLWESAPIPLGPVVFRNNLPASVTSALIKALLDLHMKNVDALEAIKAGWTEAKPADRFHVVDDRYYRTLLNKENEKAGLQIIRQFAK
jgi:phosphate/phosphite/phosphonate ABC transporter binding protein